MMYENRIFHLKFWFNLLIFILLFSTPLYGQKIEIKDGIKYIHNKGNGKWADEKNVKIKHTGILGEMEDSDPEFMFFLPEQIIGDKSGNLYVLDTGNHRIQKFDKNLKFVASFGNKGQGPGEFLLPTFIEIDPEGNINIFCSSNGRIDIFTPEGKYIKSILKRKSNFFFRYLSTNEIIVRDARLGSGYKGDDKGDILFHLFDRELNKIRSFGRSHFFNKHKEMRKFMGANRMRFTIDNKDNIYAAFIHQNKIQKYSYNGKLVFTLDRPISDLFPSKYKKSPFSVAGSKSIALDSKGRIWVLSRKDFGGMENKAGVGINESGTCYVWGNADKLDFDHHTLELFSSEGILLKIFTLNSWADNFWIFNDKIYVLDKMRGMRFHIYDIEID